MFHIMKMRKTSTLLGKLFPFLVLHIAFSYEIGMAHQDTLIANWSFRFNHNIQLLKKVTSVAYDKNSGSTIIAFEPAIPTQPNIINIKFGPVKEDLLDSSPEINLAEISRGPVRQISVSAEGTYTVFGGKSRELVLLKNGLNYGVFTLDGEITSAIFNNSSANILAVGDSKGKITLISPDKKLILRTIKFFDEEITSLTFSEENELIVVGKDAGIYQIDVRSGKVINKIETRGLKEKLYHLTGLAPCSQPRISQVIYVQPYNMIVTLHGWDYCDNYRIRIWDRKSGNHIKDIATNKFPVFKMVWVSKLNHLFFTDHMQNLWKLSPVDFSLSLMGNLHSTLIQYISTKKEKKIFTTMGNVNSIISIPDSSYLIIGTGSYFKGGPGVFLIELTENSFKHIANIMMYITGTMTQHISENLFHDKR